MKKMIIIAVALVLAMGASAQRFGHGFGGGRVYVAPPRVSVGIGLGYSPFYYSPFGYNPYGYNNYGYSRTYRHSKLDLKVEDIKNDYQDKIWSAKHDDSLSRKEKRRVVHQLRVERDQAVTDAKRDYYKY